MAEHADTAGPIDDQALVDDASAKKRSRLRLSDSRVLIAAGLVVIAALTAVGGWLGYRAHQIREAQAQRNLYVQVARQAAVNLTTIDYAEVDADIKRILDSATGSLYDDFHDRSQPFVDVVKKVQSKSVGTVAEAALLSETKDQAQVLVAVSVKTTMAAAPEQEPRRWRMRISIQQTGDGTKVSKVDFVP